MALAPASSLLFSLRCRLHSSYLHPLHRTAKYIITQVLSDGTRGEDTRMLAISHNCGQSDSRTELLQHPFTSQPPITTVGLQNTVLTVLYHPHRVPFYPKRRNQFLLTDSSSTHVPRICKKNGSVELGTAHDATWQQQPRFNPLSGPEFQVERTFNGVFYKPNPGLGHAHTIRLMVMSRSRRVFRVGHPPRCIHSGIFVLFSLGLHAARIINAGSSIRGSSVLLYGV